MTDDRSQQKDQGLSSLSVDPDLLARELAAEDDVDPLDAIQLDDAEQDSSLEIARACDQGLVLLRGNHGERLQGLQVFCEHRDPRSIALLLPLLQNSCPVERMSAVYALGRNPSPPAVEPLLQLLQLLRVYHRRLHNLAPQPLALPLLVALPPCLELLLHSHFLRDAFRLTDKVHSVR